ncbi:MAG TPA: lipid droplet-associated protein [Pseudonocardiaceae bacterium]|jgi:hypothetical protein|nr:lipid droplet-associated protein [Pseudonocardiaceae bacterium]
MKPLPLPLRVAAGLAVTAVDRARHLPEKLAELPVTVVSQALQLSMRVQQQVTELAIKGDEALSTLRPVEEAPEWATFDEDELGKRYDASPNWSADHNGSRSKFDSVELSSVEVDELDHPGEDTADDTDTAAVLDTAAVIEDTTATADDDTDHDDVNEADEATPAALPNYAELSLPQVRARLRRLSVPQLDELIDFEHDHANRPEFVGMLTRRMNTLRDQQ